MIQISKIEEILPQTQCRQCGYHDCADYAKAIAVGEKHNRCPAGGPQVISRLSALLGREELPLNEECGEHVPPEIAETDPNKCIGCRLCSDACPTDAIIGSPKHMHFVDESEVDSRRPPRPCQLACPVDCISMVRIDREWTDGLARQSKENYLKRNQRRAKIRQEEENLLNAKSLTADKRDFVANLIRRKILNESGKAPRNS